MNFTCAAVASFCLMFLVQWNIATNPPRRQKFVETYWESWIFKVSDTPFIYLSTTKISTSHAYLVLQEKLQHFAKMEVSFEFSC